MKNVIKTPWLEGVAEKLQKTDYWSLAPVPGITFHILRFAMNTTTSLRIVTELDQATWYPFCCGFPFLNACWTAVLSTGNLRKQISRLRKLRFFVQEQEVDLVRRKRIFIHIP